MIFELLIWEKDQHISHACFVWSILGCSSFLFLAFLLFSLFLFVFAFAFVFICFCFCWFICMFGFSYCFYLFGLFCLFWCFDLCLFSCPFSFGHCVVSSSTIYGFWLPLWYLKTLLFIFTLKWITEEHWKNKNQQPMFPIVNFPFISSNNPTLTNKLSLPFTTRMRILGLVPSTVMFSTQCKLIR